MENVVLTLHLLLALALIGVVLMQRSEGGGLGMGGGGGGGGGAMSGRSAATALSKLTWILAIGFITTSLTLTILATQASQGNSVIDRLGSTLEGVEPPADDPLIPVVPAPEPLDLNSPATPPTPE